jgi:PAS domain S-box-containing protein
VNLTPIDATPWQKGPDRRTTNPRLRALINIGLELASERDSHRLLQRLSVNTRDLFDAAYVTIGIIDPCNRMLQPVIACGAEATRWIKTGDAVPGILGTVIAERRTLRGANRGGDPARLDLPVQHPEVRAFLATPIASPTRAYGWMCVVRNAGPPFTRADEHLIRALTGQVGRIFELEHEILERTRAEEALRRERDRAQRYLTDRNQALGSLRTAEERMRFALQNANVGIWDMDFATGVLRWSEILEAQYGLPPGTFGGTFESFMDCVHPDDRDAVRETIGRARTSGVDFSVHHRSIRPDGTVRWLNGAGRVHLGEHGEPLRAVGISQDVTARRALEAQYQQAQKMGAIGRLAGGVAHDFNNLLTVILGHCELSLADLAPDGPRHRNLVEIQRAGARAAGLTEQLLAFSRQQIIESTVLDLNVVVADMQAMLDRLIGEDVQIVLGLSPYPALVHANRGQLEQIILNLALNARDAMLSGGMLTIDIAIAELGQHDVQTHHLGRPGPSAMLTVTDTGTGMTPQVQARLFEPFFTTKGPGKGTGLGLTTVHDIAMRSGGHVTVSTEVGRGTSVTVHFPQVVGAEIVAQATPPVARSGPGMQTVLVVEDEDGLRDVAKRLLMQQGHPVLVAANADEAVELFEGNASIEVLLTDVVMPGLSGPELARQLVERRPGLKVIYMSGYLEDTIVRHGVLRPGIAFLRKPFSAETLGRKIREMFDQGVSLDPDAGAPGSSPSQSVFLGDS